VVLASVVLTRPHGADLRSAPEPSLFVFVPLSSPFRLSVDSVSPFVNLRCLRPLHERPGVDLASRILLGAADWLIGAWKDRVSFLPGAF